MAVRLRCFRQPSCVAPLWRAVVEARRGEAMLAPLGWAAILLGWAPLGLP